MERRTPTGRQRAPIDAIFVVLLALTGCTRGERAAPTTWGFDPLATQRQAESTCYVSARYVVVERDLLDQVGADLYVRRRSTPDAAPRCDADSTAGDIVFRTGEAAGRHPDSQHFLGLKGDLLFAWDGTGAASDLYIYDLNKRTKALMIEGADENVEWLAPSTPAVWVTKAYAQSAIAVGCPDTVPSMTPQMDSLMSFDLQTLILRQTGKYRCIVTQ